jgi:hypothetical protein
LTPVPVLMTINEAIDKIAEALFDNDEPGMRDTFNGDLVLTEIGVVRLRKILKEFRGSGKKSG